MIVSPKCAVELLEIYKYLDENLKKSIDDNFINYLKKIKDLDYKFKIDTNVPLYENEFLDETVEFLNQWVN